MQFRGLTHGSLTDMPHSPLSKYLVISKKRLSHLVLYLNEAYTDADWTRF